jgi:hypothetical protein
LIAGRALSIFGTPGKLQAKAMKVANEYCAREHSGTEAVLQSAEGRKAQSGWGAGGGGFAAGGGGNNAEAEVIFTCEAPDAANP